ncbi:hypothetical protein HDV05_002382 [Chytridiales sp. JEL 0842]|nr:hypothetical protein HDV05_002382 [Chytridiales sp. JEL 0842]
MTTRTTTKAHRIIICLLRYDLRIHDNPILFHANQHLQSTHLLPIFCFDPRQVDISAIPLPGLDKFTPPLTRHYGFPKSGACRTKFLLESVADLQKNLKSRGSDLLVGFGRPEDVVKRVVDGLIGKGHAVLDIYYQKEFTAEEITVERNLAKASQVPTRHFFGSMLYRPDQLPFKPQQAPAIFTQFRKYAEAARDDIEKPFDMPTTFKPFPTAEVHSLKKEGHLSDVIVGKSVLDWEVEFLRNLPHPAKKPDGTLDLDTRTAFPFKGGETAALARVEDYFFNTDLISKYKETRNGLVGHAYSSKLSPWLANGSISPRMIESRLRHYEKTKLSNESTYWLYFELLWRDFFKFMAIKYGNSIFYLEGMIGAGKQRTWKEHKLDTQSWQSGQTGIPFVDANMRELLHTGFMANRGRQNVASFLAHDISTNWILGAEWFESLLLDHDPASNYGNWQYVAGVGNDPRQGRQFNMIKQAKDYDPEGAFVKLWCPELKMVSMEMVHTPWLIKGLQGKELQAVYPPPLVVLPHWMKHSERKDEGKVKGNPSETVSGRKWTKKGRG